MNNPRPNRIAQIRKAKGLSQQQLAEKVGSHWITISKLERGQMQLTAQWMDRLSDALDVDSADFLSGKNSVKEIPLLGYIKDGGVLDLVDHGASATISISWKNEMASGWFEVRSHDLEPFFFKRDLIQIIRIHDDFIGSFKGRMGLISLDDGRAIFGILHECLGGLTYNVRTTRHEIIRSVNVIEFGVIAGCHIVFDLQPDISD